MYTYIIVDDEKLIRQGTLKKLSALEDTVKCIGEGENGKECIALIEQLHPDIVILDMQMPVMDGTELLPYLFAHYPDMPLVVISGYRDFDYVKHAIEAQAIDYVLKPFNKEVIQRAMQNAINRLESKSQIESQIQSSEEQKEEAYYEYDIQYLKNLILGYHTTNSGISSKKLGYINDTHNLFLVTFYYKSAGTMANPNPISSESLIPNIQSFLKENGFGDLALFLSHSDKPQIGFLILFFPETPSTDPFIYVKQVADASIAWLEQQDVQVIAGISKEHNDLSDLNEAFKECSSALNMQPLHPSAIKYRFYKEFTHDMNINWPKQDEFLFRIEAGTSQDVEKLNTELFEYYLQIPNCTLEDVKYHCYLLSGLCRNIMSYYIKQDISSESNSMQNVVTSIFSLKELEEYYRNFFVNICNMLECRSVYAIDDIIEKLKIYVGRNYQKDLNLEYISSLFYMNRSYLSHLFRQKTDCKFVDYVNQVRVEKAKDLLLHSDRKMYQIARSAGYDNVKYFFRVFKKYTGVTPVQFQVEHGISEVEAKTL